MTAVFVPSTVKRVFAFLVDSVITNIFWLPVTVQLLGSWFQAQEIKVQWQWVVACGVLVFCYKWFFYYFLGGTLGKLFVGLRVVNKNDPDSGLGLMQSLLRVLAEQLSLFFGFAPQVLMFLRFDRTHLADWVAETRVVQFHERATPAARRPLMAFILFLYFFVSGFGSAYKTIRMTTFEEGSFVLHPEGPAEEICVDQSC